MKWIKCSERLPDVLTNVIIYVYDDSFNEILIGHLDIKKQWDSLYEYDAPVTHWMPLPDPPNKKE